MNSKILQSSKQFFISSFEYECYLLAFSSVWSQMTRSKCLDNLWQSNFLCTPFYFTYCKKQTMKNRPSNWSRFSTFDFQLLIGVDCRHQAISRKVRSEWKKGSWPGGWYHLRSKEGTTKLFTRDIQITENLFWLMIHRNSHNLEKGFLTKNLSEKCHLTYIR